MRAVHENSSSRATAASYYTIPDQRASEFVGRVSILKELEKRLLIKQNSQTMTLVGSHGVGKTQVALQFARMVEQNYPQYSIFWVDALNAETMEHSYDEIEKTLNLPRLKYRRENVKDLVSKYLNLEYKGKWLLVVDNANEMDLLLHPHSSTEVADYLQQNENSLMLFITRRYQIATKLQTDIIKLGNMGKQEAYDLLISLMSSRRTKLRESETAVYRLLDELNYWPQAIKNAAENLNRNGRVLFSAYIPLWREINKIGRANFFLAVESGNKELVESALQLCVEDVNIRDADGLTAQYLASARARLGTLRLLIQYGADLDIQKDGDLTTPIFTAAASNHPDIVKLLGREGANFESATDLGVTPLIRAAVRGSYKIVKVLLEMGANPNTRTKDGRSALNEASRSRHLAIVEALLQKDADVELANGISRTPLHHAVMKNNIGIVKILLEARADPNVRDKNSITPLYRAAMTGQVEIIRSLLEANADVNMVGPNNWSPVNIATLHGQYKAVKLLVRSGAYISLTTVAGWIPLYTAASRNHLKLIEFWLDNGADVNSQNEEAGITPLQIATERNHLQSVRLLVDRGASINSTDRNGNSALIFAARKGHFE
jgi:ankyrin repeat protein